MKYVFYGADVAKMPAVNPQYTNVRDPRHLYRMLTVLWSADTCAPRMRENWTKENYTLGQCSITAFLVQDIFGGEVYGIPRGDGNFHCYNVVNDCVFDLTSEQFGEEVLVYENNPLQAREVHFAKEEKKQRYEVLKKKLDEVVPTLMTRKEAADFNYRCGDHGYSMWSCGEERYGRYMRSTLEEEREQNDFESVGRMITAYEETHSVFDITRALKHLKWEKKYADYGMRILEVYEKCIFQTDFQKLIMAEQMVGSPGWGCGYCRLCFYEDVLERVHKASEQYYDIHFEENTTIDGFPSEKLITRAEKIREEAEKSYAYMKSPKYHEDYKEVMKRIQNS